MPESYDGTEGNAALGAGMPVMDGNEGRRNGWRAINRSRDLIVTWVTSLFPLSIARGGHGANNAANARTNLGIKASNIPSNGATGDANSNLQTDIEFIWDNMTPSGSYLPLAGGVVTGHIFVPNSVAAVSSYTNAFINGDGRISRGASSERYKENITAAPELGDLFAVGLAEWEMIGGDGSRMLGYIAERLAENPATARFVVHDAEGRPDSIDWFQLLMAQNAQLHARLKTVEDRV